MQTPANWPANDLAKIIENGILTAVASCIVSYVDPEGLRHAVEVDAESLYEAAALAIRTFRQHNCEPNHGSNLEVEIRTSVIHTVTPKKIQDWLARGPNLPRDIAMKERVRRLLLR